MTAAELMVFLSLYIAGQVIDENTYQWLFLN